MASKSIKKWLADNAGATILMALLALLVVSMVAATILAAANSTVRQAKADQEFEQNELSLQSAASLVAEDVKQQNNGFKVVASRILTENLNEAGAYDDPVPGAWDVTAEGKSYFADQLRDAVEQVYCGENVKLNYRCVESAKSTISATFKNQESNLDITIPVTASFKMEHEDAISDKNPARDTLIFTLCPAEYGSDGLRLHVSEKDSQTLYVRFNTISSSTKSPPTVSQDGKQRTYTETCTYTWNVYKFFASSNGV